MCVLGRRHRSVSPRCPPGRGRGAAGIKLMCPFDWDVGHPDVGFHTLSVRLGGRFWITVTREGVARGEQLGLPHPGALTNKRLSTREPPLPAHPSSSRDPGRLLPPIQTPSPASPRTRTGANHQPSRDPGLCTGASQLHDHVSGLLPVVSSPVQCLVCAPLVPAPLENPDKEQSKGRARRRTFYLEFTLFEFESCTWTVPSKEWIYLK